MSGLQTGETGEPGPAAGLSQQTFLERHGISPVAFAFFSLLLVFLLYQGVGGLATILIFGVKPGNENVNGFRVATLLGQLLLLLIPALLVTRLAASNPREFLRLRAPRAREVLIPLFGILSLQQVLQVYMVLQERIPLPKSLLPIIDQLKHVIEEGYKVLVRSSSVPELIFVVFAVALVPALAEEILFRGFVQRSFEKKLGGRRAFLLAGLIFAMYHVNPFSFIPLVVLGVYLGFLAYRADSIWVSVAAHFYNNLFACIAAYFRLDDDFVVPGGSQALSLPVLGLTFVSFSVVFLISTYYFMLVTRPVSSPSAS